MSPLQYPGRRSAVAVDGGRDDYDVWLFDLDGTLVDVDPAYAREVFDEVGDRLGAEFSDRDVTVLWHGLRGSRDDYLRAMGVDPGRFWSVFHEVEDPVARAEATFLYADAARVGRLDAPVGVVTHCQSYLTDAVLDHLDVRDWFDAVVCCTDRTGWKPDPRPVELALADLGVDVAAGAARPTDAVRADGAGAGGHAGEAPAGRDVDGVLVGDGPGDVGAAWNASLDGVHVERHGPVVRGGAVVADRQVRGLDELPDL